MKNLFIVLSVFVIIFLLFESAEKNSTVIESEEVPETVIVEPTEENLEGHEIHQALLDSSDGSFEIFYNENTEVFSLVPLIPGFMEEVDAIRYGSLSTEVWMLFSQEIKTLSETIEETGGPGYTLSVVDPNDTNQVLLTYEDGELLYDGVIGN